MAAGSHHYVVVASSRHLIVVKVTPLRSSLYLPRHNDRKLEAYATLKRDIFFVVGIGKRVVGRCRSIAASCCRTAIAGRQNFEANCFSI